MIKKVLFVLVLAIQFAAISNVAVADPDIPECLPCKTK